MASAQAPWSQAELRYELLRTKFLWQEHIMASHSKDSPVALKSRMKLAKKARKAEKRLRKEERKATLEEKDAEASLNQACIQINGADLTKKVCTALLHDRAVRHMFQCMSSYGMMAGVPSPEMKVS